MFNFKKRYKIADLRMKNQESLEDIIRRKILNKFKTEKLKITKKKKPIEFLFVELIDILLKFKHIERLNTF